MAVISALLKILATLGLVVLNLVFVAAEFAAVTARTTRFPRHARDSMSGRASLFIKTRLDRSSLRLPVR